ncbi:nucleotidyltransferase domain-containing protein [Paenibacillus xerothermodurans]|uniref:Polymerase nucleotidyl transferase domain-containing protein n=1 Tax=Paenibacillus xerothermodurans TaxID=1977292 RepID=A0A2W1NDC6_PAEXE|nr:nucleotidyltransferase domain-containing protein [Paenibacillus xerothermodurans]PZE21101.1 hypothetical protein CBW46_010520 [Paenibacillus xerothermodurans]
MNEWERAVDIFLRDWRSKPEVIGAMVCGSYITGNPSPRSDIDVHIILSDAVDWRERGNRICRGFLIEYFANTPKQIRGYFQEDFNDRRTMSMVQFITGSIVFDTAGVIGQLRREAQEWRERQHTGLTEASLELKKYAIWDTLDNLYDCFEGQRADFHFSYHNSLMRLFKEYCEVLQLEPIPYYQIYSYLSDSMYLAKYLKSRFPDEAFKHMFIQALQEADRNKMMQYYDRLSQHVLTQMGGFDIDGWTLRSPTEV